MRFCLLVASLLLPPGIVHADWQAVEVVTTYTISGMSGAELYASIGTHGPTVRGERRAIAHTNFKLTWSRDYQKRGNACVLASARPKLIITYTLPRPQGRLPDGVRQRWETFFTGMRDHERVHGEMIRDLVRAIETATVGLSVADDPRCSKIREEMTRRLSAISAAHQQRNRDFDRAEMSEGGNIQRLILALINGE